MIDLRSDTVTRPTQAMKSYMMDAAVGDDVFNEDPTVHELEQKIASLFGKEAALYCPSGTMTNQIAIRVNTQPQDEVICDQNAHVYKYEGGGASYNSMVSMKLLPGDLGRISAHQVQENINPDDIHFPKSSLVALENTANKGGGCYYDIKNIEAIHKVATDNGLKMHLDGARIFNALVETGEDPKLYGQCFDTISVCFSKGLGAPIGSALVGSTETIKEAKRVRKVFGGAMRQVGYLAAACIYALDHHIDRMKEDHARARVLADVLKDVPYTESVLPVPTNIVIFSLDKSLEVPVVLEKMKAQGLLAVPFGKHEIRLVTHLDFTDEMLDEASTILKGLSGSL